MARMTDDGFLAEQYRLHAATVFRRCLIMGRGDAAWAQDVTHDVFIRLMEHKDSLDTSSPLLGWLLTVAYRLCANRLRHERTVWARVRELLMGSQEAEPVTPRSPEPEPEALGSRLMKALEGLPPKQRAVLVMHYLDGLSQTSIAKSLDLSEGYVSKLLARALEHLRARDWEVDRERP